MKMSLKMSDNLTEALAELTLRLYRPPGYKRLHYSHLIETGIAALKSPGFDTLDRAEQQDRVAGPILKEANRQGVDDADSWRDAGDMAGLLLDAFFYGVCAGSLARLPQEAASLAEGVEFVARQQTGGRPGPKGGPHSQASDGPRRKLTTTVSETTYDWLAAQGGPIGEVIDRLVAREQS